MTGPDCVGPKPLKIGDIELANRVLLAPMSGVTDAPFRRLAARLGAGLVVSEMTASDDLVNGKPMSRLRCEAAGIGPHVVQLAGCEAHWMAKGARVAEAAGADIIDINMGCPARHVTGGQSGSASRGPRSGSDGRPGSAGAGRAGSSRSSSNGQADAGGRQGDGQWSTEGKQSGPGGERAGRSAPDGERTDRSKPGGGQKPGGPEWKTGRGRRQA